jgi:uncharacterized membrane protein YhiD involved in acid resistance
MGHTATAVLGTLLVVVILAVLPRLENRVHPDKSLRLPPGS